MARQTVATQRPGVIVNLALEAPYREAARATHDMVSKLGMMGLTISRLDSKRLTGVRLDGMNTTLIPILSQMGFGAVVGFVVGFTLKKVSKLAAILLGLVFILLQVLAYYGIVTIHWQPVAAWWARFSEPEVLQGHWAVVRAILFANLPACGGAIPGFLLGLKIG